MNPIQDSLSFLVEIVFQLAMLLVLLRFWFGVIRVNFQNPVVIPIVKLTQPSFAWLRRFVPGLFGVDLSGLVLFLALAVVKLLILTWISGLGGFDFKPLSALVWAFAKFLDASIWMFIIAIIVQALMSWFVPHGGHPMSILLSDLTGPILQPIRQRLPSFSGIDFSGIVAFIALNFLQKLIVSPLSSIATQLM